MITHPIYILYKHHAEYMLLDDNILNETNYKIIFDVIVYFDKKYLTTLRGRIQTAFITTFI